ncbi:M1 family metallopeptidase [Stakelama sp. CBK3Z-3]|uniref:M1 family metallopeptidase n=1 Tax=Stakelama flava TaxID=2860338 RepID=A0ABS6XP23_9SPHN|nr:M1 family metallopeptidase [Stakelama flava]MBW4331513.1 M1 family metallopeptidase [Stakelama flava]
MKKLLVAPALLLVAAPAVAQEYHPRETFAPLDLSQGVNRYRSSNGLPGPDYWQNHADYAIRATLDTKAKALRGSERITYTNNSPDTLRIIWLHVEQNLYKAESRGYLANGGPVRGTTGGAMIDSAAIGIGKGESQPVTPTINDTRMQIVLPAPLKPGESATIEIAWHFTIPGTFGGRMAWGTSRDGEIYDLAQWYPRVAVYDDIRGWDPLPYLSQEFYSEYGDFDYWLTVPSDMIVAGSGELMNPKDVLTPTQIDRLDKARRSDKTVTIRSPQEIDDPASRPKRDGTLTWHFRMENTRDVAWTASSKFAWDAARINLPDGKSALAQSVYPAESAGPDRWGRSTEYVKDAVERFSAKWYPYPWPNAINVAGPATGMEYPGIVFDGIDDKGKMLFWITAHEIGHGWFPMIVGFDERRHAWMDEGFNTFIDVYESDEFNHGEYAPKRDGEYAPGGGNPVDEILPILADKDAPPIMSRADTVIEKYRHPVTYFKTALGLVLLREQILGPKRFDHAFRRFADAWAFKHPKPDDFFRAMASDAGEDLDYYWRGWFLNNWQMDLAATRIAYVDNDPTKGALVTVEARDKLIIPATLRVTFADGSTKDVRLPAETWIRQAATAVPVGGTSKVVKAEIDPDHKLPDKDRKNNVVTG